MSFAFIVSIGSGLMTVKLRYAAGAAHAVPLVAQPASHQRKRITRIDWFGHAPVRRHAEFGATARGGEHAIRIEPRSPRRLALAQWPLLRAGTIEQRVVQPGDVKVAREWSRCSLKMSSGFALKQFPPPLGRDGEVVAEGTNVPLPALSLKGEGESAVPAAAQTPPRFPSRALPHPVAAARRSHA